VSESLDFFVSLFLSFSLCLSLRRANVGGDVKTISPFSGTEVIHVLLKITIY